MIGAWGDVTFFVTEKEMRTFDAFKRSESARWSKHDIHGQKSKAEYVGMEPGKLSFTMHFSAFHGVNPRKELDKFVKKARHGDADILVIGNKRIGVGKWYIPDVGEDWNYFDNKGNVLSAKISVNMEEYV